MLIHFFFLKCSLVNFLRLIQYGPQASFIVVALIHFSVLSLDCSKLNAAQRSDNDLDPGSCKTDSLLNIKG